jgi:hypothetical protein
VREVRQDEDVYEHAACDVGLEAVGVAVTDLDDLLRQVSEEALDGAIEAIHLRKIGASEEAKIMDEEAAYFRREHRRLWLRGAFAATGTAIPDLGEVQLEARLNEWMAKKEQRTDEGEAR